MDAKRGALVCGWRGLSLAVSAIVGHPVGVGQVRWVVESRALPLGQRLGASLVFDINEVDTVAALVSGRLPRQSAESGGDGRREDQA